MAARGSYAGRTQYTASTRAFSSQGFFFLRFLGGIDRLFEDFLVSSDSRIVRESPPVPRLAQPGRKPSHLGCPRVPACRQACSPWMVSFPSCFWPFLSESASSGTALFRRPSWAALLSGLRGLRFVLPFFFRGGGPGAHRVSSGSL